MASKSGDPRGTSEAALTGKQGGYAPEAHDETDCPFPDCDAVLGAGLSRVKHIREEHT